MLCYPKPDKTIKPFAGQEGYVNNVTGEGSSDHPALDFFRSLIEKERAKQEELLRQQQLKSPSNTNKLASKAATLPAVLKPEMYTQPKTPSSSEMFRNQWMEFSSENGKYYHNFAKAKTTKNLVPSMSLVVAPVVAKQSQNLLRKKSEFMPRLLRFRSWWQQTQVRHDALLTQFLLLFYYYYYYHYYYYVVS